MCTADPPRPTARSTAALLLLALLLPGCKELWVSLFVARAGAQRVAENEQQRAADRAACGRECGANQRCNRLYSPPQCTPTLGAVGTRCGLGPDGRGYGCATGLRCVGSLGAETCVGLPAEGEPCHHETLERECAPGFACLADDRCHRACGDCGIAHVCNTLYDPPQCVLEAMPPGTRCGRYERANGHGTTFLTCSMSVCAGPPGQQTCVPEGTGPRCSNRNCPSGMRCADDETCVP